MYWLNDILHFTDDCENISDKLYFYVTVLSIISSEWVFHSEFFRPTLSYCSRFSESESYFPLRETYTEPWYVSECYSPCRTLKGSLNKVSSMHYTGCTIEHCVPSQFQRPNLFYTSQVPSTLNQTGSDNKHQLFRALSLSVTH